MLLTSFSLMYKKVNSKLRNYLKLLSTQISLVINCDTCITVHGFITSTDMQRHNRSHLRSAHKFLRLFIYNMQLTTEYTHIITVKLSNTSTTRTQSTL